MDVLLSQLESFVPKASSAFKQSKEGEVTTILETVERSLKLIRSIRIEERRTGGEKQKEGEKENERTSRNFPIIIFNHFDTLLNTIPSSPLLPLLLRWSSQISSSGLSHVILCCESDFLLKRVSSFKEMRDKVRLVRIVEPNEETVKEYLSSHIPFLSSKQKNKFEENNLTTPATIPIQQNVDKKGIVGWLTRYSISKVLQTVQNFSSNSKQEKQKETEKEEKQQQQKQEKKEKEEQEKEEQQKLMGKGNDNERKVVEGIVREIGCSLKDLYTFIRLSRMEKGTPDTHQILERMKGQLKEKVLSEGFGNNWFSSVPEKEWSQVSLWKLLKQMCSQNKAELNYTQVLLDIFSGNEKALNSLLFSTSLFTVMDSPQDHHKLIVPASKLHQRVFEGLIREPSLYFQLEKLELKKEVEEIEQYILKAESELKTIKEAGDCATSRKEFLVEKVAVWTKLIQEKERAFEHKRHSFLSKN